MRRSPCSHAVVFWSGNYGAKTDSFSYAVKNASNAWQTLSVVTQANVINDRVDRETMITPPCFTAFRLNLLHRNGAGYAIREIELYATGV